MTALIKQLGPLTIVVALFGAAIGYLLSANNSIGNWLLAAFLFGHGWIHTMYVMPRQVVQPAPAAGGMSWPFELDHSWLPGVGGGGQRALGITLVAVTVLLYTLAALASISLVVPVGAWPALVLVATLASALLMAVFFNPGLLIGLAIDAVLLWVVLMRIWQPV